MLTSWKAYKFLVFSYMKQISIYPFYFLSFDLKSGKTNFLNSWLMNTGEKKRLEDTAYSNWQIIYIKFAIKNTIKYCLYWPFAEILLNFNNPLLIISN